MKEEWMKTMEGKPVRVLIPETPEDHRLLDEMEARGELEVGDGWSSEERAAAAAARAEEESETP